MRDSSEEACSGPTVVMGVTGCIAAYKACDLARRLVGDQVTVKTIMTQAATRFVGPLTFRTITGEPVVTSIWDVSTAAPVHHVSLAQEADLLLIAPCTANVIAKLAAGRCDDMLTTTALATTAPIIIAPAMNTAMWMAEVTQDNVRLLRRRGCMFIDPEFGLLACGDVGEGRLASIDVIHRLVIEELQRVKDLQGCSILVTAGPTREPIDPVRHISNSSSGITGYSIAEEAVRRGACVTLVSGPTSLPAPAGVVYRPVTTAREMLEATLAAYGGADVVIATAAVSDFRPAETSDAKIKKTEDPLSLNMVRNPDILATLAADKGSRLLVGFAAETSDIIENAQSKLYLKHLDLVVANDVSDPAMGFGSADNDVIFIDSTGITKLPTQSKKAIAKRLLDDVAHKWRHRAATKE